jgi:hypothetical protein
LDNVTCPGGVQTENELQKWKPLDVKSTYNLSGENVVF